MSPHESVLPHVSVGQIEKHKEERQVEYQFPYDRRPHSVEEPEYLEGMHPLHVYDLLPVLYLEGEQNQGDCEVPELNKRSDC